MKKVLENMMLGILGGQTPVITGMARQAGSKREKPGLLPKACIGCWE